MRRVGASRIERGEYTMPRALRRGPAARRRQEPEPGLRLAGETASQRAGQGGWTHGGRP